jgi:hypothetical protein
LILLTLRPSFTDMLHQRRGLYSITRLPPRKVQTALGCRQSSVLTVYFVITCCFFCRALAMNTGATMGHATCEMNQHNTATDLRNPFVQDQATRSIESPNVEKRAWSTEFPAPPFRGALAFADLIIRSIKHESCYNTTCLLSSRTSGPCAFFKSIGEQ